MFFKALLVSAAFAASGDDAKLCEGCENDSCYETTPAGGKQTGGGSGKGKDGADDDETAVDKTEGDGSSNPSENTKNPDNKSTGNRRLQDNKDGKTDKRKKLLNYVRTCKQHAQ